MTSIKNMTGRSAAFMCIITAVVFYAVNMGWFRVYVLIPVILHTALFYGVSVSAWKRTGKTWDILGCLLYISYTAAYITMPDYKIKGEFYWFFGILRADANIMLISKTAFLISSVIILVRLIASVKGIFAPPWWRKYTVLDLRGGRLTPISAEGENMLLIKYDDGAQIHVGYFAKDRKYYITCKGKGPDDITAVYSREEIPVALQKVINSFRKGA